MIETQEEPSVAAAEQFAVLARDFQARIVNYSPTGCLIETNSRIDVGTIGTLRFVIDGREFADDVQIVRCQAVEGAGSQFRIGARFLWTVYPGRDSLRQALGSQSVDGPASSADKSDRAASSRTRIRNH